jgi:hypothetical protein
MCWEYTHSFRRKTRSAPWILRNDNVRLPLSKSSWRVCVLIRRQTRPFGNSALCSFVKEGQMLAMAYGVVSSVFDVSLHSYILSGDLVLALQEENSRDVHVHAQHVRFSWLHHSSFLLPFPALQRRSPHPHLARRGRRGSQLATRIRRSDIRDYIGSINGPVFSS